MEIIQYTVLNNRYHIQRLLGQGGMGAVYLAKDTALEHDVAVKVNRDPSPQAATRFIAEARMLAALRHPHLPRVIDYFIESENQFLVMDYIPGDDLNTLLQKFGKLPVEMVTHWIEQLGSALSYLHHQSPPIIHRDIKPANLKLTNENEIVLVDFGIAKKVDSSQATVAGTAGYTPGYAPPEQYNSGLIGPFTDQYALAATLYHLLTGQKPADSIQRLLEQEMLIPIGTLNPSVPIPMQAAIQQALSVRPEDRFSSIEEFISAAGKNFNSATVRVNYVQPVPAASWSQPPTPFQAAPFQPAPQQIQHKPAQPFKWVAISLAVLLVFVIAGTLLYSQGVFTPAMPAPTLTPLPAASPTLSAVVLPSATQVSSPTVQPTQPPVPTASAQPTLVPTLRPTSTATPIPFAKGRGIAFSSDRADGKTLQIWLMDVRLNDQGMVTAGDMRQLTFDEGDKTQPAWSPDGNRLLYVAPGGKSANGLDNGLDIFQLDLSASIQKSVNLTRRPGDDTDPAWSPDGQWIAFTNNGRSDKVKMIDRMAADGSNIQRISVDLQEFNPTWSPAMDLLYITFARENNILYWRTKASNYAENTFYDNKAMSTRTGQAADPVWSPDGSQIAYTRMEQIVNGTAYGNIHSMVAATRGDQITKLTALSWDRDPAWSPDSQWIVFTSRRDLNLEIYVVRASGGQAVNLTGRTGVDQQPAWRP